MATRIFCSGTTGQSATSSWSAGVALDADDDIAGSTAVPTAPHLGRLEINLSAISGAAEVTFYLSHDSAGERAITPNTADGSTQAINVHPTDVTKGAVNWPLDTPLFKLDSLYLWVKLDNGTATYEAILHGEVRS